VGLTYLYPWLRGDRPRRAGRIVAAFEITAGFRLAVALFIGIALAVGSVIFMPMLGIAKQRLADQLGSAATKGEGRQNMLCAYLAVALLVGLIGNAALGAWWLDPVVGLLIAAVAVKEGREAWRGEGCCVSAPPGLATTDAGAGCGDDCCSRTR
jgi:hypothetical protein